VTDTEGDVAQDPNIEDRARQDEWLVVRCQLGERPAFDALIERWHAPLWRYVRQLTSNDDVAQEIAREVWLRVVRGISRLRDGAKLRAWLFGIARRVLVDRLRAQYAMPLVAENEIADVPVEDAGVLGNLALLLAALGMTVVVVSLWVTEPALPLRTHVAFGVMTAIGLSWSAFAIWVLTSRRVLFARQRVVAGRMAVTFAAVFTAGALAAAVATGAAAALAAGGTGVVMVAVAVVILRRAHRASARLMARREALERELAGSVR
jgi:hypothetical protein